MRLFIPKEVLSGNPKPPEIYLCTTGRKIIGEIPAYAVSGTFKWNSYSDVTFSVDRQYTNVLTGETVIHPLFDKIEGPRNIYIRDIGYFTLQDSETVYNDKDSKTMTAFSLEYATAGTKYIENFIVNKGGATSKDYLDLANCVEDRVYEKFGIKLQKEIEIL